MSSRQREGMVALIQHNISSVLGMYLLSFEVSQLWTFYALFAKLWSSYFFALPGYSQHYELVWCANTSDYSRSCLRGSMFPLCDWSQLSFWCRKINVFSFRRVQYSKYRTHSCKSAHMSCLDSAAHHTCVFPPPLLETSYESRPNPVPFKHVGTDFSGTWICLPFQAGYCFEPLHLKL